MPNGPREIQHVLSHLAARIRQYVLMEGGALVLAVLGLLFWCSLLIDWGYFLIERDELPSAVRFLVLVAGLSAAALTFLVLVAARWFREMRSRALALVLERRFPELNDRLVTAVEMSDGVENAPFLTQALLQRTVADAREITKSLDLGQVFNKRPLMRATGAGLTLWISIFAFAILFQDAFGLWFRRNVLLAEVPFQRETEIKVYVLASPGERVVEFRDGVYKHPRGGDLTLVAEVLPGKKVPDQVQVRFSGPGGSSSAYCSQVGDRRFRHTITGLQGNIDVRFLAGDAERKRHRVIVVDPPQVDEIVLHCEYPAYTGRNEIRQGAVVREAVAVQSPTVELPLGTDIRLEAKTNKPLVGVRIQTEQFDLVFDHGGATLKLFQGNDGQAAGGTYNIVPSPELLHADGMSFVIPVVLGHPRKTQLVGEDGKVILPLALPAEASLRMFLVDADDVHTTEPSRLGLVGRLDEPPKIDVQARGVDAVITRKALIPVAGTIVDDYGVVQARFEYKVDAADQFTPRPMSRAARGEKEFRLAMSDAQPFERFEVLPLQLTVGQRLAIAVFAEDGDDLTGPHGTHSVAVTYEIVSEEELLSRLYGRELNLRERFERILEETKATRADLAAHQAPLNEYEQMRREPAGAGDAAARTQRMDELQDAVIGSVERARQGVGKNHNETRSVEQGFRDIREEMVNNVVDTPESLSRLDEKLILPLHGINETDFPGVDDELGLYRLALGENRDAAGLLDETLDRMDLMILHMEQVLTEMRRMETFKELVELLKAIKAQQDALKEETERERKRRILEGLE